MTAAAPPIHRQLYAALTLIDRGALSPNARARCMAKSPDAVHAQNILEYGGGGNLDNASAALNATQFS